MPKADVYTGPDLSLPPDERVKALLKEFAHNPKNQYWDTTCLREVEFISADIDTQSVEFELTVSPLLCNRAGSLHGGCSTTLMDTLTSTALLTIARPGYIDAGHVSRTLTTTFLRPVAAGTKVKISCHVVAAGRTTAHMRGVMTTMDGKVCVTCDHDKAIFSKPRAVL